MFQQQHVLIRIACIVAAVVVLGTVVTPVHAVDRNGPVECPIPEAADRIIVELASAEPQAIDALIVANQGEAKSVYGPVDAQLPAGRYQVTLVSFDDHSQYYNQNKEQYFLELLDSDSSTAAITGTIGDLPDDQDFRTQIVDVSLSVSNDITRVRAVHPAYPTNNAQSIIPLCAAFDPIPECPFKPQAGRTIVDFGDPTDNQIRSDMSEDRARVGPFASTLPSGRYSVSLASWDIHDVEEETQAKEQWFALLRNSSTQVATSSSISDLPDDMSTIVEQVDAELVVEEDFDDVMALHSDYPDTNSANSIVPLCMALDVLAPQTCEAPDLPNAVSRTTETGESFLYERDFGTTTASTTITVSDLPSSLVYTFASSTLSIEGTVDTPDEYEIAITLENECGSDTMMLNLDAEDGGVCIAPEWNVAAQRVGTVGESFEYEIALAGTITSTTTLEVEGLPAGMRFDEDEMAIEGAPEEAGTYTVELSAENQCGSDTAQIELTVDEEEEEEEDVCDAGDEITVASPGTQFVEAGSFFSHTIQTTGGAVDRFFVVGLPEGVTSSGSRISGSPAIPGTYRVGMTATNACGLDSNFFDLVVTSVAAVSLEGIPDTGVGLNIAKSPALYAAVVFGGSTLLLLVSWSAAARPRHVRVRRRS